MNFKLGTGFTLDSEVSGECVNGPAIVCGKLSILSSEIYCGALRIDAGYYISNKAGAPFAYLVKGESLNIIGNSKR